MRAVAISLSALLLLGLVGCGGSDDGPVRPTATFAATGPGDAWNYFVRIDFGAFGHYPGTITEALTSDTYNSAPCIRFTRTFNLQLSTGPSVITSFEEISPTGQLLAESVNGEAVAVTSDTFRVPSTLTPTTSASGQITLANGDVFTETYKVVGKERVLTGAGNFDCWVVEQTVVHSDTTTDTFRSWVAPQTGNYVQIVDTTVNPDGTGYTYTAFLTSLVTPTAAPARSEALLGSRSAPRGLPANLRTLPHTQQN